MSRHRIVRAMNYEDEYYDDDEEYSRSVEDNYCISPSTAAQFTWNRERNVNFAAYVGHEEVIDEEGEIEEQNIGVPSQETFKNVSDSPNLSQFDQVRMNSCLEEIQKILGGTVAESIIRDVIIKNSYDLEASLHQLLSQQETPKPQRERRQNRRNQLQDSEKACQSNPSNAPDCSDRTNSQSQAINVPNLPKPIPTVSTPVVKSSKSASKVTVGFQAKPEPSSISTPAPSTSTDQDGNTRAKNSKTDAIQSFSAKESSSATMTPNKSSKAASRLQLKVTDKNEKPMDATVNLLNDNLKSAVENMGLEGDKEVIQATVESAKSSQSIPSTPKSSKSKASKLDIMAEYAKRHGDKELLNLVVIGHVDAGKSTLMGHLLYQLGSVNKRTMHKYEQESKKLGKSSFAFAWVLDETDEERSRGVTMDVAQTRFDTEKKHITLLDAPGHKDFIPNMITGASQADVAILVINAAKGEFETGFDAGGQTREHALLARSLGVGQIIVAVNKMDMVDWSQERYKLITKKIGQFLTKQAGFRESDVSFIPCSGLSGENLTTQSCIEELTSWYNPPITLVEKIDNLRPPPRPIDKPFRLNISDIFKGVGTGFNISGRVGSGFVQPGDKVLVSPSNLNVNIKGITVDDAPVHVAFAGDHVTATLSGVDMVSVNIGNVLCDPASPSKSAMRFRAKIVIFNIDVPITKGYPVVFHYQSVNEPAVVKRLLSQLNRSTGEVLKNKPRCLTKNSSAVVEIELERPLCLELYADFKDLGRFMLRSGGHTIAAGLIEEVLQSKAPLNGASQS